MSIPKVVIKSHSLYQNPRSTYYHSPNRSNTTDYPRTQFDMDQIKKTCSCQENYHAPYGPRTQFDMDQIKKTCPSCKSWEGYHMSRDHVLHGNNRLTRSDPYNDALSAVVNY